MSSPPKPNDALRAVSLFEALSDQEIADISAIASFERFQAGEVLFRTGDEGRCMWIIVEGQVDVYLDLDAPDHILASVRRRGILGELSLIEPTTRSACAIAQQDSLLLRIDHEPFLALQDALNPAPFKLLRELSRLVCYRVRSVNKRIEQISHDAINTEERRRTITDVLKMLWNPSEKHG